jgi:hypothetical protein
MKVASTLFLLASAFFLSAEAHPFSPDSHNHGHAAIARRLSARGNTPEIEEKHRTTHATVRPTPTPSPSPGFSPQTQANNKSVNFDDGS